MKKLALAIATFTIIGFAGSVMADEGIFCDSQQGQMGKPGPLANELSENSQGGGNPFGPGIGNLAASFNPGNPLLQPPVLLNSFCVIQNGEGQGPGHPD